MKVYLASVSVTKARKDHPVLHSHIRHGHKLHSYYHCHSEKGLEYEWWYLLLDMMRENNNIDLFLDSGAFSAKRLGVTINLQDYINFVKQHESLLTVYANLDVIGDPKATWKNQLEMERAGLQPLPVFHYGSDPKWLERILSRGYDYMALGGFMAAGSTENIMRWLDYIWSRYLTDKDGMPKVKVHGFAITSHPLLRRYPWYSVDSTTWVLVGAMGGVIVPRIVRAGKYDYSKPPMILAVSGRSLQSVTGTDKHIDTLTPHKRQLVLGYIHEKGFSIGESRFRYEPINYQLREHEKRAKKLGDKMLVEEIIEPGLCNDQNSRKLLNIIYFQDLEKHLPKWPWPFRKRPTGFCL